MTTAEKQDEQQLRERCNQRLERAIAAIDWTDSPVQLTRHVRQRKVAYTVNGAEPYRLSNLTEAQMVQVYRTLKTWCETNPGLECGSHFRDQSPRIWCPRVFRDEARFCAREECTECGGYYGHQDDAWRGITDHRAYWRWSSAPKLHILHAEPSTEGRDDFRRYDPRGLRVLRLDTRYSTYIPGMHWPVFFMSAAAAARLRVPAGWEHWWYPPFEAG